MKTIFTVTGTHCHSCAELIKDVCSDFPEIKKCEVDFKTGKTVIEHEGKIDFKKLKKEIENVGEYKVEGA